MAALRLVLAFVVALLAMPLQAQQPRPNHIRAELVAQSGDPRPGGIVNLAIVFTPDAGWHGYWKIPGDAGAGATFDWSLPKGVTAGAPLYPVPERLLIAGLMNHVYNGPHALIVQMKLPRGIAPGTPLPIRAKASWLACTDKICVPEDGELAIDLRAGAGTTTPDSQSRFDAYWQKLPRPLDREARYERRGDVLRIGIPYPAASAVTEPWFYAATENALVYAHPQRVSRKGELLIVETRAAGNAEAIEGLLAIGPDRGLSIRAVPGAVPAIGEPVAQNGIDVRALLLALAGAIAGGLLLNLMPCVFPIISLKALSVAKAGGDERAARADALAYTGGVVLTCLALGGLLLALRAGGQAIGWAFQLQSPAILFLLLLLAVAITLNLLGVFELRGFGGGRTLADRRGPAGAFWTGALAAFVATPCTGPFMAAALGAALVLPAAAALAIFAGLGFGLALPFLALGFIPALRSRLPRPGRWMVTFRRLMALPMALTAVALVWLLWRRGGDAALLSALAGITVLALIAFLHGKSQRSGTASAALAAMTGVGLLGFGAQAWSIERLSPLASANRSSAHDSIAFNQAQLEKLRDQGRPVFLYFTADWCLTCKVNEKTAIEREDVAKAFDRADVAVMVGDWTAGDPSITRFLEQHGRSGVPLYLYYAPGRKPRELPQILTPSMLTGLTNQARA